MDMAFEHYNGIIKVGLRNMEPNNTNKNAVHRSCRSLEVNNKILANYDLMVGTLRSYSKHKKGLNRIDLQKIVAELMENQTMEVKLGRKYKHYSNADQSLLHGFNLSETFKWIEQHKKHSASGLKAR